MILQTEALVSGPGFLGIVYCAALWVMTMFIVLCNRAGIQIVGAVIAFIGFLSLFFYANVLLPLTVFAAGCFIHWFGRMLHHLRRRN